LQRAGELADWIWEWGNGRRGGDGGWNGRDGEGFMGRDDCAAPLDAGNGGQQLSDLSGGLVGVGESVRGFGIFFVAVMLC